MVEKFELLRLALNNFSIKVPCFSNSYTGSQTLFRSILFIFLWIASGSVIAETIEKRAQTYLNLAGYNVGSVDGIIGPKTRQSINSAYLDAGLVFDNKIDQEDVTQLRQIYFDKQKLAGRDDPLLSKVMDVADARHFLERTGIGANLFDIKQLVGTTRADAVHALLSQMDGTIQTPLPSFVFEDEVD